jgi:hypothetical protein
MPQTHWHEETLTKPMEASYNGRQSKANTIRSFLDTAPPGATCVFSQLALYYSILPYACMTYHAKTLFQVHLPLHYCCPCMSGTLKRV